MTSLDISNVLTHTNYINRYGNRIHYIYKTTIPACRTSTHRFTPRGARSTVLAILHTHYARIRLIHLHTMPLRCKFSVDSHSLMVHLQSLTLCVLILRARHTPLARVSVECVRVETMRTIIMGASRDD